MIRCPNEDCRYHGMDYCYQNIELIELPNGGLRCINYVPRITPKDLDAPFNCNCKKVHGKYHNVK